ncbi:SURF1 family protein [Achromobacter deleyi]|uniref:SURF1 family protein n=1 Tax=Achromobacter deleyi TaxID=1353891 RepID=UPI0014919354|nr:SURF1 family protein [Achromobacter deleyi]QVQ26461.1 SURF1 family protein [Achromobacter deleyi]UIP22031.1 SURF1 family protein [Achromobacter deleyi]
MAAVKDISTRDTSRNPRSKTTLVILGLVAAAVFAGLCALGTWQVQRLAWKRALIAQVDQRAHAPATPAPARNEWPGLTSDNAEYRHVAASGTYQFDRQTLVQAATELGSGYWVMTPLQLPDGGTVLVNRGFVLPEWRKSQTSTAQPPAEARVTGLLRMGEPGSGFLRNNDPASNLWYSRDLQAIAAARGLTDVAPYFIDADAASSAGRDPAREPVGGLTVLTFPNNHLVYAITWYALALMVIVGVVIFVREEKRGRRKI